MAKILYVEDHPAQRDILAQMLELNGFEVIVAADGLEGVKKAYTSLPDLILMDLRMPRMDGFEAIRILRGQERTAGTPIIAVSAWASARHKERALAAGVDEHFTKPVDLNKLLTTISRYLKQGLTDERHRWHKYLEAKQEAAYAEKKELAYQLGLWQSNPELASTLEQLTKLTSGIIHDLRNRLGILQNYVPRASYCLRLLEGLAFLRFRPSLSRQPHGESSKKPEILAKDLEFGLDKFQVQIIPPSPGITVKGLMDSKMLSQGLWLLLQAMSGKPSKSNKIQTISSKKHIIEIKDMRLTDPLWGFYITFSTSSLPNPILPEKVMVRNVLLGDELALYFFLLEKAVALHWRANALSIDETGRIEIRLPAASSTDIQYIQSITQGAVKEISKLKDQYIGSEPNIYPLIKGLVSAILQELDDIIEKAENESNLKEKEIIQRNSRYAQLLLQNLLWLGAGIELPKELVDVGDTLQSVREIMRSEIRERTDDDDEDDFIKVKLELEPNLPPVSANKVSLQQVFMNLITNALEAMPESGTLALRAFRGGLAVCVEVSDTGSGINSKNLDRIFDLAFSTKKGHERGTGLYIVKSIVDKLGGKINVRSKPGSGTTFTVCLPSLRDFS